MTVLLVYNGCVIELTKVWRQQGLSVPTKMETFNGGIFNTWFLKVGSASCFSISVFSTWSLDDGVVLKLSPCTLSLKNQIEIR